VTAQIEARSPDQDALFVAQLRQPVTPSPSPLLPPRVQIVAQVPFTASKVGEYKVSAHITIVGDDQEIKSEVTATRQIQVSDAVTMRPPNS
jgi:hypothetical protein